MNRTNVTFHKGSLEYFTIDELEKTGNVAALFTTAKNTAWKFGTDGSLENYKRLAEIYGITTDDMCTTFQTHTPNVLVMKKENQGEGVVRMQSARNYDGIVTNEKRFMLCSFEADCVPVYFFDSEKSVISLVHSGWRGTAQEICKNAVECMTRTFGCRSKNITAVIGPCACKNCYEVGSDLIESFEVHFKDSIDRLFIPCGGGKYTLDMALAIETSLVRSGIERDNIFSVDMCTIKNSRLCSFRRTKSKTEHMLTAIMIK